MIKIHSIALTAIISAVLLSTTASASIPAMMFSKMTKEHQIAYANGIITAIKHNQEVSSCATFLSSKTLIELLKDDIEKHPEIGKINNSIERLIRSCLK